MKADDNRSPTTGLSGKLSKAGIEASYLYRGTIINNCNASVFAGVSDSENASDGKPYPVLGYYMGPGFNSNLVSSWKDLPENKTVLRKRVSNADTRKL